MVSLLTLMSAVITSALLQTSFMIVLLSDSTAADLPSLDVVKNLVGSKPPPQPPTKPNPAPKPPTSPPESSFRYREVKDPPRFDSSESFDRVKRPPPPRPKSPHPFEASSPMVEREDASPKTLKELDENAPQFEEYIHDDYPNQEGKEGPQQRGRGLYERRKKKNPKQPRSRNEA